MKHSLLSKMDVLDQDLNRLLETLREYTDEELNRSPGPGRWSALQVLQHLMLVENLSLKSVERRLGRRQADEINGTNLLTGGRRIVLGWILSLPFGWKAPEVVAGESFSDQTTFWAVAREYRQIRISLRELVRTVPEEFYHKQLYKHPIVGKMGLSGMLHFFDRHFTRHRRQILRALR